MTAAATTPTIMTWPRGQARSGPAGDHRSGQRARARSGGWCCGGRSGRKLLDKRCTRHFLGADCRLEDGFASAGIVSVSVSSPWSLEDNGDLELYGRVAHFGRCSRRKQIQHTKTVASKPGGHCDDVSAKHKQLQSPSFLLHCTGRHQEASIAGHLSCACTARCVPYQPPPNEDGLISSLRCGRSWASLGSHPSPSSRLDDRSRAAVRRLAHHHWQPSRGRSFQFA